MSRRRALLLGAANLYALLAGSARAEDAPATPVVAPAPIKACDGGQLPAGLHTSKWVRKRSAIISQATPMHGASDAITVPGVAVQIEAKFAYSRLSKDLEREGVELWMSRCEGGDYQRITSGLTDDKGRVSFTIPAARLAGPGRYAARLRVAGDGTTAAATVWVLPKGSPVVVFDIDGTLTTSDGELFRDVQAGMFDPRERADHAPTARVSGAALTQRWAGLHYPVVYLTGRPVWLADRSRGWLTSGGFAPGVLWLTSAKRQLLPTEGSVGAYKLGRLRALAALGLRVEAAYGNAATDIYAYKQAGVPAAQTYIVGPRGGEQGTQALGEDYAAHLKALGAAAP